MPSGTFVPQFVQKAMISPFFKVTVIHHSIFVPQPLQKRCPAITSVPQFGQKRFAAGACCTGCVKRVPHSCKSWFPPDYRPRNWGSYAPAPRLPGGHVPRLGTFEGGFPPPACWLRVNLALPYLRIVLAAIRLIYLPSETGIDFFPPFPRTLSSRSGH